MRHGRGIAVLAAPMLLIAAAPPALTSTSIELPADEAMLPEGPGAEIVTANCSGCHSASMIMAQPTLPAAKWRETVEKMRTVYKAPIADADVPAIVAYLAAIEPERTPR